MKSRDSAGLVRADVGLLSTELVPTAERHIEEAWERFVSGEAIASAHVSKCVLSSWQRSRRSGVDVDVGLAPLAAHGDALNQLRSHNNELLWAAQGLFITTAHLLARSGSIMLLTDPNGVVLEVAGDMRIAEAAQDIHLMAGGNWHEGVVGTNGIGTALATRLPVQVHASEHFRESVRRWTCAAAPVFLPGTDRILGVVDISGPPSSHQVNSLVLAVAAARQIEAVLAERLSREHSHLLDACLRFSGRQDASAVMVLNSSGQLIHVSGNLPGTELRLGGCVPGLEPGRPIEEWARRLPEGLRPEWLHPVSVDRRAIGALLVVPKRSSHGGSAAAAASYASASASASANSGNRATSVLGAAPRGDGSGSEVDTKRSSFDGLLGHSPALRAAVERAQMLSGRRVAVLIQGETGVGKELFARAVHGDEARSGPFVTFNCGATTKELIGSELFGHVRGAFTGATHEGRAGRFELAHGGTLCLDEIGELPLELQPVLLRALEEGVVCRLGEAKPRRVDVRLLAMTNRDLLEEVQAGRFRRDLYHRISVTRIRVPPLRERQQDIEELTTHFNHSLAERHGIAPRNFGPQVLAMLSAYSWPGNVRELRNAVESLLLTCDDFQVACEELPEELLSALDCVAVASPRTSFEGADTSLEEAERLAIMRAVKNCHGNLAQAARVLGVSRSTLYRKVERYNLEGLVHPSEPE